MFIKISNLLFLLTFIEFQNCVNGMNLKFEELTMCPEYPDTKIKINFTLNNDDDKVSKFSAQWLVPLDIGEGHKGTVTVELKMGKTWMKVFTLRDKNICNMMRRHWGEVWVQLQKSAKIPVNICPITRGRYNIEDFAVDLSKLRIKLPPGELRFQGMVHDITTEEILSCFMGRFVVKSD